MSLLYLRWGSVARDPRTFSPGPGCCLGEWLDGIGEPVRVHDEVEQLNADEPDIRVLVVLDPVELGLELLKAEEGGERRPDRVGELEAEGVLLGVVGVGVHGVRIPQSRCGCTGVTKKVFALRTCKPTAVAPTLGGWNGDAAAPCEGGEPPWSAVPQPQEAETLATTLKPFGSMAR